MDRVFPSKVDPAVAVILVFGAAFPPIMVGILAITSRQHFLAPFGFLSTVILLLVAIPVRYRLEDRQLTIQCGVIRVRVPYESIVSVQPTRNPISSPALSLDRLAIEHAKGTVMISPASRSMFLDELEARTGLVRYGDSLKRER